MADVVLDGRALRDERDLHAAFVEQLDLGPHYGANWHALRDRLLTDVPRPVTIRWLHTAESARRLGRDVVSRYVELLLEAQQQDVDLGFDARLVVVLA